MEILAPNVFGLSLRNKSSSVGLPLIGPAKSRSAMSTAALMLPTRSPRMSRVRQAFPMIVAPLSYGMVGDFLHCLLIEIDFISYFYQQLWNLRAFASLRG